MRRKFVNLFGKPLSPKVTGTEKGKFGTFDNQSDESFSYTRLDILTKRKLRHVPGILDWIDLNERWYYPRCIWHYVVRIVLFRWVRRR